MAYIEKNKKIIIIVLLILILIILEITIGYIGYKYNKNNRFNNKNNINDIDNNNNINDEVNNNDTNEEKYNISLLSQKEALNAIKNSNNAEDLICSMPEYSDEDQFGKKGVNYIYCYLKYNRSDNNKFSMRYDVLDNMIFKDFNVSVSGIKSLLNDDNKYSYGTQSAFLGQVFLSNNYNQDIIEIKIEIVQPLESIIEFSYNNLTSFIKLNEVTYFGDYIYTTSEKNGKYDMYKYDKNSKKYDLVSNYQCKEIKYTTSYNSEYGKYKEIDTCVKEYSTSGFMIMEENYLLLDMNSGKTWNYDKYFLMENNGINFSFVRDFGNYIVAEKNGKYGIVKSNGDVIVDFKYEQLGDNSNNDNIVNEMNLNYSSIDTIIFKDNNKYGLMKLSNGDILVPATNEYIKLFVFAIGSEIDSKYYKVYNNGKWTIHDFKTNNVAYKDNNADDIYYINSNLLLVREKEKLYFKDFNGNKLTNSAIEIYVDNNETNFDCDNIEYYLDGDDKDILNIIIYHVGYCAGEYTGGNILDEYSYNIKTRNLEKLSK